MGVRKDILSKERKKELYKGIIPIAYEFRKSFIGEDKLIDDTFGILERLGFFIVRFPSQNDNLSGFHIKKSGIDCIYINSNHTLGRQFFSAWHECYHATTGEGGEVSFKDKRNCDEIEYKAECFAGMILMPENLIKDYLRKNKITLKYIGYVNMIKMQNYFQVSYTAMLQRLIQVFPNEESNLNKYFAISKNNEKQKLRLITKTKEANGNIDLIKPTIDMYISPSFMENIQFNLKEGRISEEKAWSLINLIESIGNSDE